MHINHISNSEKGFTLVELVVVMLIIGVVVMGAISTASPILKKGRMTATRSNMNEIIQVLSVYAQTNNRIPCPANPDRTDTDPPYGFERGSGTDGEDLGVCTGEEEGIVPFRTLGISEDIIKDGWKHYITYRVSPVFTLDPDDPDREVHERCRVVNKWVFNFDSHNAPKARFCCPGADTAATGPGTDIIIEDALSRIWPFDRDGKNGSYSDSEDPYLGALDFDVVDDNVTVPAFVLVSHGINGVGAFLPDSGGVRVDDGGGAINEGLDEEVNNDGDIAFRIVPISQTDNNSYFDDIVMWRTQDQLYAETGKATCMEP